jgi:hypothetical protein
MTSTTDTLRTETTTLYAQTRDWLASHATSSEPYSLTDLCNALNTTPDTLTPILNKFIEQGHM